MSEEAAVPAPSTVKMKANRFAFDLTGGRLMRLFVKNFFLTIVTLGIYRFWAKIRKRQMLYSSFILNDQRFEYTGTVREAFMGFLKLMGLLIVLSIPIIALSILDVAHGDALQGIITLGLLFLVVPALYYALRYRVSRTRYRNIAFTYNQPFGEYFSGLVLPSLARLVTLGLVAPWADCKIRETFFNACSYGQTPFQMNIKRDGLWAKHLLTWVLYIPTLGISRYWYRAFLRERTCAGLRLGELRFKSTATPGTMIKTIWGNIALFFLTLGIGYPWALCRIARFFANNTIVGGDLDAFIAARASAEKTGAAGDDMVAIDDMFGAM